MVLAAVLGLHGSAAAAGDDRGNDGAPPPAGDKAACAQAFEQAQRLQKDTKYLAANRELLKCANPTCGDILFRECSKMYTELQDAIPTVVFSARDGQAGSERTNVTVSMDGQELLQQLDGRPMPIDPGAHHFVFTTSGRDPVEQDFVVRAGDKFRQIVAVFPEPRSEQPAAPPPVQSAPPPPEPSRSIPTGSYVLAGVGVVALGVFGAFRLVGSNKYDDLSKHCAPNCSESEVDKARKDYLASNVALGVGAAALASAVIFYVAAPNRSTSTALAVTPGPSGLSARLVTRF